MVRGFGESRDLLLSPSRSDLVVQSCYFFPCSKSRDLGPEHGFRACSFKNKRKQLDFHIFGCKNVPGSIFNTVSHFCNFFRLQKRAWVGGQTSLGLHDKKACGVGNLTTSTRKTKKNQEKRRIFGKLGNRKIPKILGNKH